MSVQGRVVWHDLMAKDVEAAKRFYGELFGWRIATEGRSTFVYGADDQHFASMVPFEGPRAHWVPYLAVEDLAATAEAVRAHGGKASPEMEAGRTGRFLIVDDPGGAVVTAFQYTGGTPKPERDGAAPVGAFVWDELLAPDLGAAERFYAAVFGFSVKHMTMPAGGRYALFGRAARGLDGEPRIAGGARALPSYIPRPFWLSYVAVADCDAATRKAEALGATVTSPPITVDGFGRFTTLLDPQQAPISILTRA